MLTSDDYVLKYNFQKAKETNALYKDLKKTLTSSLNINKSRREKIIEEDKMKETFDSFFEDSKIISSSKFDLSKYVFNIDR